MIKSLKILVVCALCTIVQQGFAQIAITGKVTDETGQGMTGVSILEMGTNNGAITGPDGSYSIAVQDNDARLRFSFLSYRTITLAVGDQTVINVTMAEEASQLETVVVTAIGLEQDKDNLGKEIDHEWSITHCGQES